MFTVISNIQEYFYLSLHVLSLTLRLHVILGTRRALGVPGACDARGHMGASKRARTWKRPRTSPLEHRCGDGQQSAESCSREGSFHTVMQQLNEYLL